MYFLAKEGKIETKEFWATFGQAVLCSKESKLEVYMKERAHSVKHLNDIPRHEAYEDDTETSISLEGFMVDYDKYQQNNSRVLKTNCAKVSVL